ncbi:hypothetical protein KKA00_11190, partial [bacterium]|nr:hypothetical protein [bacterium]
MKSLYSDDLAFSDERLAAMMADDVVISDKKTKWSDLIREEDYWSIWFGFIIIFGSLLMWIPKVPKVGKWTTDPLDAFLITSGETTTTIFLSLFILMAALGILTAIGIAAMRTNRFFEYLAGFCG